jgi:hypothetical protein
MNSWTEDSVVALKRAIQEYSNEGENIPWKKIKEDIPSLANYSTNALRAQGCALRGTI